MLCVNLERARCASKSKIKKNVSYKHKINCFTVSVAYATLFCGICAKALEKKTCACLQLVLVSLRRGHEYFIRLRAQIDYLHLVVWQAYISWRDY